VGSKDDEIVVRLGVGVDRHLSGDNKKALECLNEIREVVQKSGIKRLEPRVLAALSEVWLAKKDLAKASEFCGKLLGMTEKAGLKPYHARGKWTRGEVLLSRAYTMSDASSKKARTRVLRDAEAEFKESVRLAEEIGAKPLLWQAHASLGKVYQRSGDDKAASKQFQEAKAVIEKIASTIGDEKLKDTFLNSKQVRSVFTQGHIS
jgi:tetratricopeptide (TPR) repeat protein